MSKGDGTALWIDLVLWNAELVDAPHALAGKGLVNLKDVDLVLAHAGLVQHDGDGGPRPDAHEQRFDADDAGLHEFADNGLPEALGDAAPHHEHGGGAVADLRRVTGVDAAVLCKGGADLAERLGRHALAHAVVARDGDFLLLVRLWVRPLDLERHNLVVEQARLLRRDGLAVRLGCKGVLRAAGHVAVARHVLGELAHGHLAVGGFLVRLEQVGEFGHGGGAGIGGTLWSECAVENGGLKTNGAPVLCRHALHAGAHAHVDHAALDLVGHVDAGHQARRALPVERLDGSRLREAGHERRAAELGGTAARREHAADGHVLDKLGIDAAARKQVLEHACQ